MLKSSPSQESSLSPTPRRKSEIREGNHRIRSTLTSSSRRSHESFKINKLKEETKLETKVADILPTIPLDEDLPKKIILFLLDFESNTTLLNYDVASKNIRSKDKTR